MTTSYTDTLGAVILVILNQLLFRCVDNIETSVLQSKKCTMNMTFDIMHIIYLFVFVCLFII